MPLTIDAANTLHPNERVTALAFSRDGKYIAYAEEGGKLTISDPAGGEQSSDQTIDGGISGIAFAPDGMVIVGGHSGDLHGYERLGGHRWTHKLGGGCDHLAVSISGDLVAVIDGARLLHLVTSGGHLISHFEAGELVKLAIHPRGESVAVADDQGNVHVLGRDGTVKFQRSARGEQGERITSICYLNDGHLCVAREALDVTMGDEEEIVIEWWTPMGQESGRIPLRQRCEVMAATSKGVACGLFDGKVIEYDSLRNGEERYKSSFSINDLVSCGEDLLVASWFHVNLIGKENDEKWQVEHTGLTEMVFSSNDGRLVVVGGDNQNDYTRETQILVLDTTAQPYIMQSGDDIDADLREFSTASPAAMVANTSEAIYGGDDDYSDLLTESEMAQMAQSKPVSSGSDDLLGLLEAEITLVDATVEEFDFEAALTEEAGRINQPPIADAGEDQIVNADSDGTAVIKLDGSRSYDEDGEIVSHTWRDVNNRVIGEAPVIKVKLPKGNHTFTLTVTDNDRASTSDAVTVQVR